jgi:5-(carboxyamino)imidazole ribonucleotide synthase
MVVDGPKRSHKPSYRHARPPKRRFALTLAINFSLCNASSSPKSPEMIERIAPGATIGVLGGGQLGRMFGIAARRLGYRVHTYESSPDSPAGQISDREFTGSYSDEAAIVEFVDSVDVITFEFENIPAAVLDRIATKKPIHPRSEVLHICQNREREKNFLRTNGYPLAPFRVVGSEEELKVALEEIGYPAVLKTADFGYDGKGQQKIMAAGDADFTPFLGGKAVLESWVDFQCEISVIAARGTNDALCTFPVAENVHSRHILDYSVIPARVPARIQQEASEMARSIAIDLDVIGLIAVEFFVTTDGKLLVNELAPRPHNSGHYTFDACITSQFEQQLRAVCGHPFGSSELLVPTVMTNLLGDLWRDGIPPDWSPILTQPRAKLHLYGKLEGRVGRKMGHYCVLGPTLDEAFKVALNIKSEIYRASLT